MLVNVQELMYKATWMSRIAVNVAAFVCADYLATQRVAARSSASKCGVATQHHGCTSARYPG